MKATRNVVAGEERAAVGLGGDGEGRAAPGDVAFRRRPAKSSEAKVAVTSMSSIVSAALSPPTRSATSRPVTRPSASDTAPPASRLAASAALVAPCVVNFTSNPAVPVTGALCPASAIRPARSRPLIFTVPDTAGSAFRASMTMVPEPGAPLTSTERMPASSTLPASFTSRPRLRSAIVAGDDLLGREVDIGVEEAEGGEVERLVRRRAFGSGRAELREVDLAGGELHADAWPRPVEGGAEPAGDRHVADRAGEELGEDVGRGGGQGALDGKGAEARRVGEVGEGGEEAAEQLALGLEGAGEEAVAVEGDAVEGRAAAFGGERQPDRDALEALGRFALADVESAILFSTPR